LVLWLRLRLRLRLRLLCITLILAPRSSSSTGCYIPILHIPLLLLRLWRLLLLPVPPIALLPLRHPKSLLLDLLLLLLLLRRRR
jgi:hypothetical protein